MRDTPYPAKQPLMVCFAGLDGRTFELRLNSVPIPFPYPLLNPNKQEQL